MYSFLSNCLFILLVSGTAHYVFPNLFYNILLFINFYYRKLSKNIGNRLKSDLIIEKIENIKQINLKVIRFQYNDEKFIKLAELNSIKSNDELINLDKDKFIKTRKRIECPNNKNSFIIASIRTNNEDIDILEDIKLLSGLYFDDLGSKNVTKYLRYKYNDVSKFGILDKWEYMRNDGEEYTYNF